MADLRWRFFWAVTLSAGCLVVLCVLTAASLFHQQSTLASALRENVASRRAAVEMEECINNLISLEDKRIEEVAPLHDRLRFHLAAIRRVSDEPEEQRLADQLDIGFARYIQRWRDLPTRESDRPRHDRALI